MALRLVVEEDLRLFQVVLVCYPKNTGNTHEKIELKCFDQNRIDYNEHTPKAEIQLHIVLISIIQHFIKGAYHNPIQHELQSKPNTGKSCR